MGTTLDPTALSWAPLSLLSVVGRAFSEALAKCYSHIPMVALMRVPSFNINVLNGLAAVLAWGI